MTKETLRILLYTKDKYKKLLLKKKIIKQPKHKSANIWGEEERKRNEASKALQAKVMLHKPRISVWEILNMRYLFKIF